MTDRRALLIHYDTNSAQAIGEIDRVSTALASQVNAIGQLRVPLSHHATRVNSTLNRIAVKSESVTDAMVNDMNRIAVSVDTARKSIVNDMNAVDNSIEEIGRQMAATSRQFNIAAASMARSAGMIQTAIQGAYARGGVPPPVRGGGSNALLLAAAAGVFDDSRRTPGIPRTPTQPKPGSGRLFGGGYNISTGGGAILALGGVHAGAYAIGGIIRARAEYERMIAQLGHLNNPNKKDFAASRLYGLAEADRVTDMAIKTPFQIPEIQEMLVRFQAKGLKPTDKDILGIIDAASLGTPQALERLTTVLSRGLAGSVQLREWDMVETAGLDYTRYFREEHGLERHDITDAISTDAATTKRYTRGFLEWLKGEFGGAAQKQMNTLHGMISNLEDQLWKTGTVIGEGMREPFADAIRGFEDLLDNNTDGLKKFGEALGSVIQKMVSLIDLMSRNPEATIAVVKNIARYIAIIASFRLAASGVIAGLDMAQASSFMLRMAGFSRLPGIADGLDGGPRGRNLIGNTSWGAVGIPGLFQGWRNQYNNYQKHEALKRSGVFSPDYIDPSLVSGGFRNPIIVPGTPSGTTAHQTRAYKRAAFGAGFNPGSSLPTPIPLQLPYYPETYTHKYRDGRIVIGDDRLYSGPRRESYDNFTKRTIVSSTRPTGTSLVPYRGTSSALATVGTAASTALATMGGPSVWQALKEFSKKSLTWSNILSTAGKGITLLITPVGKIITAITGFMGVFHGLSSRFKGEGHIAASLRGIGDVLSALGNTMVNFYDRTISPVTGLPSSETIAKGFEILGDVTIVAKDVVVAGAKEAGNIFKEFMYTYFGAGGEISYADKAWLQRRRNAGDAYTPETFIEWLGLDFKKQMLIQRDDDIQKRKAEERKEEARYLSFPIDKDGNIVREYGRGASAKIVGYQRRKLNTKTGAWEIPHPLETKQFRTQKKSRETFAEIEQQLGVSNDKMISDYEQQRRQWFELSYGRGPLSGGHAKANLPSHFGWLGPGFENQINNPFMIQDGKRTSWNPKTTMYRGSTQVKLSVEEQKRVDAALYALYGGRGDMRFPLDIPMTQKEIDRKWLEDITEKDEERAQKRRINKMRFIRGWAQGFHPDDPRIQYDRDSLQQQRELIGYGMPPGDGPEKHFTGATSGILNKEWDRMMDALNNDLDSVRHIFQEFGKNVLKETGETFSKKLYQREISDPIDAFADGFMSELLDSISEASTEQAEDAGRQLAKGIVGWFKDAFNEDGKGGGSNPLSWLPFFHDGGYTGSGPRIGGVDGRGGFPAILQPGEFVLDAQNRPMVKVATPTGGTGGKIKFEFKNTTGHNIQVEEPVEKTGPSGEQILEAKIISVMEKDFGSNGNAFKALRNNSNVKPSGITSKGF